MDIVLARLIWSSGNTFHSHDGGTYTVIYQWILLSLGKTTYIHTHIITGKRSCTIQVSAELLMTGWFCRSVPYICSQHRCIMLERPTLVRYITHKRRHIKCSIHAYIHTLQQELTCYTLEQRWFTFTRTDPTDFTWSWSGHWTIFQSLILYKCVFFICRYSLSKASILTV